MSAVAPGPCPICQVHAESVFKIDGMDCHEEVAILERRLKNLGGLEAMSADVLGQRLLVKYDAARLSAAAIADAVADTGMRAWLEHEEPRIVGTSSSRQLMLAVAGASFATGLLLQLLAIAPLISMAAFAVSVLTGGLYPARRAVASIKARTLDIHVLMTIAVVGAIALGEWSEAAAVVFLFAAAQYLESRSMDRARHAIRALMDLTPADALVIRGGRDDRLPVDDVRAGDVLRIRPGAKVPLDGVVTAGASDVNQAPITGESLPVDKHPGDELFAGTINGRGALEMRVTRLRRDTTLARIIHLVDRAQAQRAPTQAFVERFARYYTPAVIATAIGIALVPPLAFQAAAADWLYRALVLLVISCPCALVISTPVSIVSALAAAARQGVLVKGGVHLERLAAVKALAFDKTGTLTRGQPAVVAVTSFNGVPAERMLALAAALESRSEHPIAAAIVAHARALAASVPAVERFRSLPGLGAEAIVHDRAALVGNMRLFKERGLLDAHGEAAVAATVTGGRTPVLLAWDGALVGMIAVADRPRRAARDVVDLLRGQGIRHVVMLSGDNAGASEAIARELGIAEHRSELLPQDKVDAVAELRSRYGTLAMVGDGVNDAPALAAADVGIAMGAAGSDAALETADIALMGDDLSRIPFALRLSRATLRNIKTNVTVSLLLKFVFLVLAITGHATLWMAIVADTGASLLVIAHGLRLLRTT
ncbi:MAG TPA: heavy metal translocating P-type ATPase [Vicinamibacterales bacterium]|nr:heavy metal translocating P-type ATPase [Vicinamibacterales bacterium]